jgi:DNA polymerase (family 10)
MDNQQIATIFEEIGQLLEIDGANRFRVLAYKNAAENIRGMGRELKELYSENPESIGELPGIGFDLQSKITEMLNTGFCQFHQELVKKYGRGLLEILQIRSIGPKKAALFYKELKIDNLEKLKAAALAHQLSSLPRMGEKSEQEILQAIEERSKYSTRMLLSEALPLAEKIIAHMQKAPGLTKLSYAGSLRRRKETVGDLDILAAPQNIDQADVLISHFQKFPLIKNIIANGPTKCSVIMENGVQADLRVVEEESFGAALHYFTGSKDHNVEIRSLAIKAHKKINEYGIFDLVKNGDTIEEKFIIGDSEENLYKAVGLSFIPPTLRENRGEFEACLGKKLPLLIELTDLQGDLNINSNYADGENSLEEICQAFQKNQLHYFAVNDTFSTSEVPSVFTSEKLIKQLAEIQHLQKKHPQLKILKSVKISINSDGSLDLPSKELLSELDFLTIKINHDFNLPEPRQTARILQALSAHPKIKLLSGPTARILNQREAIAINLEKIIKTATEKNIILEINSQPARLDLPDFQIKAAIQKGALLSINSDLKNIDQIDYLKFGIWTAQRGWAESKNIINTFPLKKLTKFLQE